MKPNQFYTQNGWAGSNYDSNLTTKEVAAKVRAYARKNFPAFKFSVKYKWSMYADSLYIEMLEGPCAPYVAGSRSEQHEYMSTMSTVEAFKDEITPDVFAALQAVTNYAASFRYDDSDGMIDYFDTNFYLTIKISYDYKIVEKAGKKEPKAIQPAETESSNGTQPEPATASLASVGGLEVVDYSRKAIAVFGDTKEMREQLKALGGRFNAALKYNGEKRAGWVFSKKRADEVRALVARNTELVNEITELYPLENIYFIETGNLDGVYYYDIEGAGIISSAKIRADIQPGDIFNVYTDDERKYGVVYDGVSVNRSLFNDLIDIIKENDKIDIEECREAAAAPAYTVSAYMKKLEGPRYATRPDNAGGYTIVDTLDNSKADLSMSKEQAERDAAYYNSRCDSDGHLISGEYQRTELDRQKERADILLQAIDGDYYTICLQRTGIELPATGVHRYSGNVAAVTRRVYEKLNKRYNVLCDF